MDGERGKIWPGAVCVMGACEVLCAHPPLWPRACARIHTHTILVLASPWAVLLCSHPCLRSLPFPILASLQILPQIAPPLRLPAPAVSQCPVQAVTVFNDRAEVTRLFEFEVSAPGQYEAMMEDLPAAVNTDSLRVKGVGHCIIQEVCGGCLYWGACGWGTLGREMSGIVSDFRDGCCWFACLVGG